VEYEEEEDTLMDDLKLVDPIDTQVEDHPTLVEPVHTQAEPVMEDQLEEENLNTTIRTLHEDPLKESLTI